MPTKAKQRMGSSNGRWKWGLSSDYRRRITNAKPGELVHHIDKNKADNKLSNFKIEKPSGGMTAIWAHNRDHPEKAIKGWKARGKQLKKC
jgi:hypothetical protein